ncbi:hypothetical protein CDL15_Pgr001657 [Punica granatum]|nr:hypothetical protein CDL15_Pgr001657 [Punica granatum]PKI44855.1 hypothetical protein CRG98_034803 [Punica granatum]
MAKVRALLLMSLVLCSALSFAAARPEPTITHHEGMVAEKYGEGVEAAASCDGVGEEECLMRRTLNAHIDYIYTQKHNNP